mgnify:CR=1 FL=1
MCELIATSVMLRRALRAADQQLGLHALPRSAALVGRAGHRRADLPRAPAPHRARAGAGGNLRGPGRHRDRPTRGSLSRGVRAGGADARGGRDGASCVSTLDEARVLEIVATQAHESLGKLDIAIWLQQQAGGPRIMVAGAGAVSRPAHRARPAAQPPARAWSRRALTERAPVWTTDVLHDPGSSSARSRGRWNEEIGGALHPRGAPRPGAPPGRPRRIGLVGQAFLSREIEYLSAFANQIAVALENARLYQDLDVRARRRLAAWPASRTSSPPRSTWTRCCGPSRRRPPSLMACGRRTPTRSTPSPDPMADDVRQDGRLRRRRWGGAPVASPRESRMSRRTRGCSPGVGGLPRDQQPARGAPSCSHDAAGVLSSTGVSRSG